MKERSLSFWAMLLFTVMVAGFLILPIGLSIMAGLTKNYFIGVSSGLTMEWVIKVWTEYQPSIWHSIALSLACLATTLILGIPAAYALSKYDGVLARAMEEIMMLPIAIPGIATALALIISYGAIGNFRTSWSFILVGHVLFTLPFMVRSILAVIQSVDVHTFKVVLPNCRSGIISGSLMVLTLSIGEFNMTLLLHTPFTPTLPVGLADAYASLRIEVGSAYTIIFFLIIIPLLLALQLANKSTRPT
jgi:putative spermidine/putrescine transport system permease protein